jgi:RND family efflux transporter MFP subunit
MSVNPNVRGGGFFEKGDVLFSIDPRDYEANVEIAEATLMDAQQVLADAEARTEQARDDWKGLGRETEVPALVLRLPQLEAARARVKASQAELRKSQLQLQRTNIVAPYAGRVLSKSVDIGQVISANSQLAEIYATEALEVRLPLRNRDLPYIELPEAFRFSDKNQENQAATILHSDLTGPASWEASLVRTEGAIDEAARQLHVIAEIKDPFGSGRESQAALKIGQYVTAQIPGTTLQNAIVIPNHSIYQGSHVFVVENDVLQRRDVVVAWQNDVDAVIKSGLAEGEQLVLTPLGQVTSGIRVTIQNQDERVVDASSELKNQTREADTP